MKKNLRPLGLLGSLLWTVCAHAAVVDQLDCQIQISDVNGAVLLRTSSSLAVTRKPLNASPAPDVVQTAGKAQLASEGNSNSHAFHLGLELQYVHFIRVDSKGAAIRAGQQTCLNFDLSFENQSAKSSCTLLIPSEPLPPGVVIGQPVDIEMGIPTFDRKARISHRVEFEDKSKALVGCTFRGTLE